MAINRLLAPLHLLQYPVAAGRNVGRRQDGDNYSIQSLKQETIRPGLQSADHVRRDYPKQAVSAEIPQSAGKMAAASKMA